MRVPLHRLIVALLTTASITMRKHSEENKQLLLRVPSGADMFPSCKTSAASLVPFADNRYDLLRHTQTLKFIPNTLSINRIIDYFIVDETTFALLLDNYSKRVDSVNAGSISSKTDLFRPHDSPFFEEQSTSGFLSTHIISLSLNSCCSEIVYVLY